MAARLLTAPSSLASGSIGQVFYHRAAALRRGGQSLFGLSIGLLGLLAALAFVPYALVVFRGQWGSELLLGRSWAQAGRFAELLAFGTFANFVYSPLSVLFAVCERQGSALIVHLLLFAVPAGVMGVAVGLALPAENLVRVLGLAQCVLFSGLAFWSVRVAAATREQA
jgi:O-antigen/teichoic acid export membrane protein